METLKEQIENLSDIDLLQVWRQVCELYNLHDDEVFENDEEFFELFGGTAYEALQRAHFGDYNWGHKYVAFNGYGNFESSDDIFELIDDTKIEDCVNQYPEQFTKWFELEESEEEE